MSVSYSKELKDFSKANKWPLVTIEIAGVEHQEAIPFEELGLLLDYWNQLMERRANALKKLPRIYVSPEPPE